ncbi:glycosyltransferase [Cyanobium sp. CH-040]|uniref:glycosyltransferase family 2 protein n=1 Tax=Cyanobium sp. CH-040 TaxID=2823708 RepID=UPI0020CDC185|nr:cellulose synthase catalytic subunit [Cyanobium sp. CH-040]MCP9927739.1 glycosyltransferase [Cyanobium sp. CH-040]
MASPLRCGAWALAVLPLAAVGMAAGLSPDDGILEVVPALLVGVWAWLLRRRPQAARTVGTRRSAIAMVTLLSGHYLAWRVGATLNLTSSSAAALSLLLLAAEFSLLGHGLLQLWLAWFREPPVAAEADQAARQLEQRIVWDPRRLLAVDALVPTRGEPLELVERSLRACLALDYPRVKVWLLDDAARPELAELCRRLGCRYLARSECRHAKAGNLNHALPHLQGDLLLVLDADVMPQRHLLRRTVGLFDDPRVGLVQTPQSYMNADPVIRNLGLERWLMPDEELFYRWIEPTRQGVGAVVCAGTSFLMRRAALEQVGGFETATSSEDLATGIRVTAAGYRALYLNEKLSAGLAPPSLEAMARQRCRWASGTLQTLRTTASPLRIAGLNPLQRLAFLEGILHWLNVIPQLVLLLMPLSYGLLGVSPLLLRDQGALTVALPLLLAQLLLVRWFSQGSRSALMPELYRWVFLVPLLLAVLSTVRGRPRAFQVTPKAATAGRPRPALSLLLPLVMLLGLQLLNLALLLRGPNPLLPLLWSAIAVLSLMAALRACWDRSPADAAVWFRPEAVGVELQQGARRWPARLTAISEGGVEVSWPEAAQAGDGLEHDRPLRIHSACLGPRPLTLRPEQVSRWRGRVQLGGVWLWRNQGECLQLQARLYRQPGAWPLRQAPPDLLAIPALLKRLVRSPRPERWFDRSTLPIRLECRPCRAVLPVLVD